MPRKFREVTVQSGKGLDSSKSGILTRSYDELHNLRVIEGNWRKRPGQDNLIAALPGTAVAANAKVITEFVHPALFDTISSDSETEFPTADVALSGYSFSSGTTAWNLIDETPVDWDTSYIQDAAHRGNAATHARAICSFPDISTAFLVIHQVQVVVHWRGLGDYDTAGTNPQPSSNVVWLVARYGGVDYISNTTNSSVFEQNPAFKGEAYTPNANMQFAQWSAPATDVSQRGVTAGFPVHPPTGAAWTPALVNATDWGVVFYHKGDGGGAFRYSGARVTRLAFIVKGNTSALAADVQRSKIFVSNTDWLRAKEDMTALEDIDTANAIATTTDANSVWDYVHINNRVYFTNGQDDMSFYPASGTSLIMATVGTGRPLGRCLGAYASRVFMGDVVESAVRTRERVLWSAINNGTDWTTATSGSLDLDETPGAVMAFVPFTEARDQTFIGVLAAFKDDSIFHLEATGVPSDPFDKRVMSSSVGCAARHTLVPITTVEGESTLMFLGRDGGYLNVFQWNGDQAASVGDPIAEELAAQVSPGLVERCWAYRDPLTNHYVLGIPASADWPNKSYVYDITNKIWTTENFEETQAIGTWRIAEKESIIFGRNDSLPYKSNLSSRSDTLVDTTTTGIESRMTTGLFRLAEEPNKRSTLYRVWIYYRAVTASAFYTVAYTTDGNNWSQHTPTPFTTVASSAREVQIQKLDCMIEGYLHGLSISSSVAGEDIEIEKIVLEYEENDTFV